MSVITREEALQKKPKECWNCGSNDIVYWDETEEEIVFQCKKCKGLIPIVFDTSKFRLYFFF